MALGILYKSPKKGLFGTTKVSDTTYNTPGYVVLEPFEDSTGVTINTGVFSKNFGINYRLGLKEAITILDALQEAG